MQNSSKILLKQSRLPALLLFCRKGITLDGQQYTVWFDDGGIAIAPGVTVLNNPEYTLVTWEQTVKRIGELLETPEQLKRFVNVQYLRATANWSVCGKNLGWNGNVKAMVAYGTKRANAYKIIDESLNLRDVRIYDTIVTDGTEKRVLNRKETELAQQKQEAIKEAFKDWIWKDPERRVRLVRLYNDTFNTHRPRQYDGSHLQFDGMNPEITLDQHQIDAAARALYGGNTLLAHCVGAGKTFGMIAIAMMSKRLGLCEKSMIAVPNHLTEQWASDFLTLFPSANILVARKKDFERKNRRKFCARIATGDYDAVIIGHSQFGMIPVSAERQRRLLEEEIDGITESIEALKVQKGERFTVKQLARMRKPLEVKLKKLTDTRKDDVVTFEELGVDRLMVDEADMFKNLFLYTKMRNVSRIGQTDSQRASDLFLKCRYMDELTGGKGIVFGTGTPEYTL